MTVLWPVIGAAGLFLIVTGSPWFSDRRLRHRIDPYVSGLDPRMARGGVPARSGWLRVVAERVPSDGGLSERLVTAGRGPAVEVFRLEQLVWGVTAALGVTAIILAVQLAGKGIDVRVVPLLGSILFVFGFLARDWWLTKEVDARLARVRDELPAAIDLITLSIMAGESVPAACARVAEAMPGGIGEEFARVMGDIRGGMPVVEALERLAIRLPEVGVGRFVDALCVGIQKGAPLAETLRAQADDGREARRRYLLEVGGRREVLMLVPVVFLIMPVVVVFALFPGLVTLELLVP